MSLFFSRLSVFPQPLKYTSAPGRQVQQGVWFDWCLIFWSSTSGCVAAFKGMTHLKYSLVCWCLRSTSYHSPSFFTPKESPVALCFSSGDWRLPIGLIFRAAFCPTLLQLLHSSVCPKDRVWRCCSAVHLTWQKPGITAQIVVFSGPCKAVAALYELLGSSSEPRTRRCMHKHLEDRQVQRVAFKNA